MPRTPPTAACPCASGKPFADCCQPLLQQTRPAPTAVALMRSRYTAFALGYFDYLIATLHPAQRAAMSVAQLQEQDHHTRWLSLQLVDHQGGQAGDTEGQVHFIARYLEGAVAGELEEHSAFRHEQGRWFYTTGTPRFRTLGKPRRNDPCPCGSGKKYKHCHP